MYPPTPPQEPIPLPFYEYEIEKARWEFDDGYLNLEIDPEGFSLWGRINGQRFDDNWEDYFFSINDIDKFTAFLEEHGLVFVIDYLNLRFPITTVNWQKEGF